MTILGIIILIIFALFIMSQWVRNAFTIAGLALERYVRSFLQIAIYVFSAILLIILLGLIFKSPALLGIGFALAILAVLAVWLPIGIVGKVFIKGAETFPGSVRAIAGWLAFMGFVGILYPNLLANIYLILGLFFLGVIFWGLSNSKSNAMRTWALILAVIMTLVVVINYASPGFSRYIKSKDKQMEKFFNIKSTENEFQATETYVRANKLAHLYNFTFNDKREVSRAYVVDLVLPKDSLALLLGLKNENVVFEEQSFIQVKLKDSKSGVYLTGAKYYVLAGDVDILVPEEPKKVNTAVNPIPEPVNPNTGLTAGTYGPGTYTFSLTEGEMVGVIEINAKHFKVTGVPGKFNIRYTDQKDFDINPDDENHSFHKKLAFWITSLAGTNQDPQTFEMKVWN